MGLSDEQKQLLKQDEENGEAFEAFLAQINKEHKDYFDSRNDERKTITHYFLLLRSGRPPAIRLRYANHRTWTKK